MRTKESEIITIKKLKKDGSVSRDVIVKVGESLAQNEVVVLPVDNIYGPVCISVKKLDSHTASLLASGDVRMEILISTFRHLGDIAEFSKSDYDFLNRVWPGEVTVVLKGKKGGTYGDTVYIRHPRNRYL
jgi:tRNA A37 threonylcarbamoyladenosine synthetase subunit TsaC/SUA5/YrdC